ncbi:GNAT family N-acetyltransferase [Actinokineospora spheciospongiae]|uniref:GNAT family N-acetyltransferase n=1 Tax=Actinokineospora spheciospongiae TaxID=909613 RepID=UPI000D71AFC9|nr:GNAT family N-acetyltransferase [Actinokineospora spheciospongiae]PWW59434.1 L-amino acid N-acyltransferase YncA [Actinokineospora spheciospongiae]
MPERVATDLRRGGLADLPAVLAMLDGAVDWLVARGRAGQWGERPLSERPARVTKIVRDHMVWLAEVAGEPVGAIMLQPAAPAHIPPASGPQLYVTLLVVDRRFAGHGIGRTLLDLAVSEARRLGLPVLRVDCFAGVDDRLVRYYRAAGFVEESRFDLNGWEGCVLSQRVLSTG